ncbi:hypothetical protein E4U42_002366 [Claviceps africana]|uniref:Rhodopsin domain-containing protein n=1 Tax=Claviceps africana TaxID=83212 RepID=A0A8K0NHJ0_9HYPO|nr:hypothetical protein E4U42_002366 [Claviceps africana]
MAENHSSWLNTAMAMFLPWSTLTFAVRVWTKMRSKTWGLDDCCVSAAVVFSLAHIAVYCVAIQHGYGRSLAEISPLNLTKAKKALYAGQIFYIICMGLCKTSASFFVAHMAHFGPQSRPAYALAGLSTLWTLASILVVAFRGPIGRPWETMDGSPVMYFRWIGIETVGLVLEFGLWILSVHLVWSLEIRRQKRSFILAAFGARLGLIPIISYRLAFLSPAQNPDPTLDTIVPSILTHGAIHFSIVAGSITCLKPFLRTFNPACAVDRRGQPTPSHNGTRDSYLKLDTLKRREQIVVDSDDSANWRPFQGLGERHVIAMPQESYACTRGERIAPPRHAAKGSIGGERRADAAPAEADGADRLVIQRTTEVSIKYEQNPQLSL